MMKAKTARSIGLTILSITVLGVLCLAASFFLYYGFFLFMEHYVYAGNHEKMSMGLVRITFTILYALLFLLLLKIKGWHLTKATLMVGPLGVAIVTLILINYRHMTQALLYVAILLATVLILLRIFKKQWFYYYAVLVAVIPALFYAWPR